MFGLPEDDTSFDTDIVIGINTALSDLGLIGEYTGTISRITDSTANWEDFIGIGVDTLEEIKTYVYLKVKMVFDPPQTKPMIDAVKDQITELGWKINVKVGGGS